MRFCVNREFLV